MKLPVRIFFLAFWIIPLFAFGQIKDHRLNAFLTPSDTVSKPRFYGLVGTGGALYAGASFVLYNAWYKETKLTGFHFFNDWGEWEFMDKTGHIYNAYYQGCLMHSMLEWSGMSDNKAILGGIITGNLIQATIEVMDGFTEKWGFSATDIAANMLGSGIFAVQQYYWDEQRIMVKYSAFPIAYDDQPNVAGNGGVMSLRQRSQDLYGTSFPELMLKDYNAQTHWLSFSISSLTGWDVVPEWLNLAVGYSGANIYGGFTNSWIKDGITYELIDSKYQRYHQFLIAPDLNWAKIKTDSAFLRSVFKLLNLVKFPAPAIELNDLDGARIVWHWLYF